MYDELYSFFFEKSFVCSHFFQVEKKIFFPFASDSDVSSKVCYTYSDFFNSFKYFVAHEALKLFIKMDFIVAV